MTMQTFRELFESDTHSRLRRRDGHDALCQGHLHQSLLRRTESQSIPTWCARFTAEYVRAGADIIETNTFGATANKLQPYGLEGSLREINIAAARIAREAAGDRAYVAGAVGPLGLRIEPYGPTSFDEAKEMFKAQAVGAARRRS